MWYHVIYRENEGVAAGIEAYRRVARVPGAWRARLWLARDALGRKDLPAALALYQEAFAIAPRPLPAVMLQQISGDLGQNGHLPEILQVVSPHFNIVHHGLAVGINLIRVNLDLGRLDAARALIDLHYAQQRPEWKEALSVCETELAQARVSIASVSPAEEMVTTLLSGDGPQWLRERSPANELFPPLTNRPIRIGFLGSTAEKTAPGAKHGYEMSDIPGNLSRAVPLFLAEQVRFRAQTAVRMFTAWLAAENPAFVVQEMPWETPVAAQHARAGENPCDYVVVTHLKAMDSLWHLELRLIRTIDARCLATASASFPAAQPQTELPALADRLLQLLGQHAELTAAPSPLLYRVPSGADFSDYLLRLEQLLTVLSAGMKGVSPEFLSGEREMLEGSLHLCLRHPDNVVVRLVFVETLVRMKKVRPQVVEEFRERALLLKREKPLPEPAQEIVGRILHEVFPG